MDLYDDHRQTSKAICLTAKELASDSKKLDDGKLPPWNMKSIFLFEPSLESYGGVASITNFVEDLYVDVSDVWDKKLEALKPFWSSQTDQSEYYTVVARYCGSQIPVKYAERYAQFRTKRVLEYHLAESASLFYSQIGVSIDKNTILKDWSL